MYTIGNNNMGGGGKVYRTGSRDVIRGGIRG